MTNRTITRRARLGTALGAIALGIASVAAPAPALAQPKAYTSGGYRPTSSVLLSLGEGELVNLPRSAADVWTSNPEVADVYVSNSRQINLFGKKPGEATIIATAADGSVVYGANVRVNQNISSINQVLHEAMPESNIRVTTVGQVAVINGTVASPEDAQQAEALVRSALNPGIAPGAPLLIQPINRLKTATPLQVNLKVRIAEVNRSLLKEIGVNLLGSSSNGFSIAQGEGIFVPAAGDVPDPGKDATGQIIRSLIGTTIGLRKNILGIDLTSRLQLAQTDGLINTLAEPNLTALSGETASFLAGGEFPVPVPQAQGAVTIEYKQYGVGLAFTPFVLADGRISMRVRPEVSELSPEGSVKLGDFVIPALTTRRAETTVELGSGQSFMIAGLLRNSAQNNINKAPFLGDLPILGSLFRSTKWQQQQTELVIIVTPYLVRPVSNQMALPTDGYRVPSDGQRTLYGQLYNGSSAPSPTAVPAPAGPAVVGATGAVAPGFKL